MTATLDKLAPPRDRFVGRQVTLHHLHTTLDEVLTGRGRIAFVVGEAGTGKSALLRELARQAQARHPELLVAVGVCNAQTGIGDPYLPFREALGLLTGDVDSKLARGEITAENAHRLRAFLRVSGEAVVNLGPDLIDLFVPGAGLALKVGSFLTGKVDWLDQLAHLRESKRSQAAGGELDQGRLFEQYTNTLKAMAARQPILLVMDDLQWADAASISLLFHLARRLGDSRILLLGAYRPDDVALGRDHDRHPLEPVLHELKRYYGDLWIDLGQAAEAEGREFVEALIDTEPNKLRADFRAALYAHTDGHALFTTELLSALQERGALARDADGAWVVQGDIDWRALPARVEGIIEERIGQLEEEARQALTIASVEGDKFTAQVVARVQELQERRLLQLLSRELDKRHHLVREQGEVRAGRLLLARYQFVHALFQQYLYHDLSQGERRLLHGDIARVLEDLYADRTDELVVQLAHHYTEAGDDEKAVEYLGRAGDRARQMYANQEAIAHYRHALDILAIPPSQFDPVWQREQQTRLHEGLGDILALIGRYDEAVAAYDKALSLAAAPEPLWQASVWRRIGAAHQGAWRYDAALAAFDQGEAALGTPPADERPDWWQAWLAVQLARGWVYYFTNKGPQMAELVARTQPVVERYGTSSQRALYFHRRVLAGLRRDRFTVSPQTLADAQACLAAAQAVGAWGELCTSEFILGFAHLWHGDLAEAEAHLTACLTLARRTGFVIEEIRSSSYLALIWRERRLVDETRRWATECLAQATTAQEPVYMGIAHANLAWVAWREGDWAATESRAQTALAIWRALPIPYPMEWLALWPLIALRLAQGDLADAVEHGRVLLRPPHQALPAALTAALEAALHAWDTGQPDAAQARLTEAVELAHNLAYL